MTAKVPTLDEIGLVYDTDKTSRQNNFLNFYEPFFAPLRTSAKKVMEIGVFNGGSVKTWRDYFPNAEIIGADINPDVKNFAGSRLRIEIADQSKIADLDRLASLGPYDIVIDDGSHVWGHQIDSFVIIVGSVKPGGYYIIEDVDTSCGEYIRSYRDERGFSAVRFVLLLSEWVAGRRQMRHVCEVPAIEKILPLVHSVIWGEGTVLIRRKP